TYLISVRATEHSINFLVPADDINENREILVSSMRNPHTSIQSINTAATALGISLFGEPQSLLPEKGKITFIIDAGFQSVKSS
ncbi:MAG: hypothetical protein AAFN93_28585, partial [Bacteroidota bacterium]